MAGTIKFTSRGSFNKTERFLAAVGKLDISKVLKNQGEAGVRALSAATPEDSGLAASSWDYEIRQNGRSVSIIWTNSDIESGFPVALMLQYGYGTGTGGYVQGRDYINPVMKPIFDEIADTVWKAVTSA